MKKILATAIANLALTIFVFAQSPGPVTPPIPPPATQPVPLNYTLAPTPLEVPPDTVQTQRTTGPSSTGNSQNNNASKGNSNSAGNTNNTGTQSNPKKDE
jgi:hypothetical protein